MKQFVISLYLYKKGDFHILIKALFDIYEGVIG